MKLTVSFLLLVTMCHLAEVNSSRSLPNKEGEANPTVKRTLLAPGYGLDAHLYKKGLLHPGLEYGHHHHHLAGLAHDPHLAHSALVSPYHLPYGPLSPYHHARLDYSPLAHLGYHHGHHDSSDKDEDRDSSGEERESERPKSEKSSKKSKSKKSKRPSSKSSSRSEKSEEKHHSHHDHDDHKYAHLDIAHLGYPHGLLYPHHLYPHLRAGLHYPYLHQPYYQHHLGLGHQHLYNPYLQPVPYVQQSVEQQVIPYGADGQPQQVQQQVQQVPQVQQVQQPGQQQQLVQQDAAAAQQIPQAQAQSAVSYASYSQSLPQSYQQVPQQFVQGQLYQPQLQVLQPQPLFQLLGVQPVNIQPAQVLVPTPVPQLSLQSQPPNLFPESSQPVTQATLLTPVSTQPTVQTSTLVTSPTEITPVVTIKPTTQNPPASTEQVVDIKPSKASEAELKQEADNSINNSRTYLTPLFPPNQDVVIQDPQLPLVSTISPAYYGK